MVLLQQIQEQMEDGLDKKGDNKDFEEKLAEQLFADESTAKIQVGPALIQAHLCAGCKSFPSAELLTKAALEADSPHAR